MNTVSKDARIDREVSAALDKETPMRKGESDKSRHIYLCTKSCPLL